MDNREHNLPDSGSHRKHLPAVFSIEKLHLQFSTPLLMIEPHRPVEHKPLFRHFQLPFGYVCHVLVPEEEVRRGRSREKGIDVYNNSRVR